MSESPEQNSGGFWDSASKKSTEEAKRAKAIAQDPKGHKARRRGKRRTIILSVLGVLTAVLVIVVIFLPQIASGFAPGIIASQSKAAIPGSATVQDVSLSWGGPQRVDSLRLMDSAGKEVLRANVEVDRGLFSLIRSNLDLGTVTIAGLRANVVRNADGSTNIQSALIKSNPAGKPVPAAGPAAGPLGTTNETTLPKGLRANLVLTNGQISYTDNGTPANPADRGKQVFAPLKVAVSDIDIETQVESGKALFAKFAARAEQGELKADANAEAKADAKPDAKVAGTNTGKIVIEARLEPGWLREDGSLRLKDTKGKATVSATNVPVALLDAVLGPVIAGATLKESLGNDLTITLNADGAINDATANLSINSNGVQAAAAIGYKEGVVTSTSPITARVTSDALTRLLPDVAKKMREDPTARLASLPGVEVEITNLKLRASSSTGAINLANGSATIRISTDAISGQLMLKPGQAFQPFAATPLEVRITSDNLSQGVRITANTSATISGRPAGTLSIDATATGILTDAGMPIASGLPKSLSGQIAVRGMTTALVQPFVGDMADLTRDVGTAIDINITAATAAGDALVASSIPPTDLDIAIRAESLSIDAPLRLEETMIRDRGNPVRISLARGGALASKFVKPETGWELTTINGGGPIALEASDIRIERTKGTGVIDFGAIGVRAILTASSLRATALHATDAPVDLGQTRVELVMKAGVTPTLDASVSATHMGKPFRVAIKQEATGFFAKDAQGKTTIAAINARPKGTIELIDAPTTLARLMPPAKAGAASVPVANADGTGAAPAVLAPSAPPLDLAALVQSVLGPVLSLQLTTEPTRVAEAGANALSAVAVVNASNVSMTIKGSASATAMRLTEGTMQANVAPATVRTLLNAFAPGVTGAPTLKGQATMYLAIDPILMPTDSLGAVDLSRVGTVKATLSIPGKTLVEGLQFGVTANDPATGRARPAKLSAVGVEDLRLVAMVPVGAMVAAAMANERATSIDIRAGLLGSAPGVGSGGASGAAGRIATLMGTLNAEVSRGRPAGPLTARFELTDIDVRTIEALFAEGSGLSQALGERASVVVGGSLTPPEKALSGADFSPLEGVINVEATVTAPRLQTQGPIKATVEGGLVRLTQPMRIALTVPPSLANMYIAAPGPNGQRDPSQLALQEAADVSLVIDAFKMPVGKVGEPGVIDSPSRRLDASVVLGVARASLADSKGQRIVLSGTEFSLRTPRQDEPLTNPIPFTLAIREAIVNAQPPVNNMRLSGIIENHSDARGNLTLDAATLNASGNLPAFPTALIDAFAKQDGMLNDLLGPVVTVERLRVERLPLTKAGELSQRGSSARATIDVGLKTERASASIKGVVGDAVFISQTPVEVGLNEVTDALAARFLKSMPFIGKITKNKEDAPALLRATGLSVPLGNDFSRLNGEIVLDPGEARFAASDDFAGVLSELAIKQQGTVGKRLQPLNVSIKNGVATYQKWPIPLGEFNVETMGTVDLVQRKIDVITWIPFGQLSGDTARAFGIAGGLGKIAPVIQAVDMMPFRTRGSLDNPSTTPDLELFAKTFIEKLSPEKLIQDVLGDLFKPKPANPVSPK